MNVFIRIPPDIVISTPQDAAALDAKRRKALAWMQKRWLLHPANSPKRKVAKR